MNPEKREIAEDSQEPQQAAISVLDTITLLGQAYDSLTVLNTLELNNTNEYKTLLEKSKNVAQQFRLALLNRIEAKLLEQSNAFNKKLIKYGATALPQNPLYDIKEKLSLIGKNSADNSDIELGFNLNNILATFELNEGIFSQRYLIPMAKFAKKTQEKKLKEHRKDFSKAITKISENVLEFIKKELYREMLYSDLLVTSHAGLKESLEAYKSIKNDPLTMVRRIHLAFQETLVNSQKQEKIGFTAEEQTHLSKIIHEDSLTNSKPISVEIVKAIHFLNKIDATIRPETSDLNEFVTEPFHLVNFIYNNLFDRVFLTMYNALKDITIAYPKLSQWLDDIINAIPPNKTELKKTIIQYKSNLDYYFQLTMRIIMPMQEIFKNIQELQKQYPTVDFKKHISHGQAFITLLENLAKIINDKKRVYDYVQEIEALLTQHSSQSIIHSLFQSGINKPLLENIKLALSNLTIFSDETSYEKIHKKIEQQLKAAQLMPDKLDAKKPDHALIKKMLDEYQKLAKEQAKHHAQDQTTKQNENAVASLII